jgi:hypothetical protein
VGGGTTQFIPKFTSAVVFEDCTLTALSIAFVFTLAAQADAAIISLIYERVL